MGHMPTLGAGLRDNKISVAIFEVKNANRIFPHPPICCAEFVERISRSQLKSFYDINNYVLHLFPAKKNRNANIFYIGIEDGKPPHLPPRVDHQEEQPSFFISDPNFLFGYRMGTGDGPHAQSGSWAPR